MVQSKRVALADIQPHIGAVFKATRSRWSWHSIYVVWTQRLQKLVTITAFTDLEVVTRLLETINEQPRRNNALNEHQPSSSLPPTISTLSFPVIFSFFTIFTFFCCSFFFIFNLYHLRAILLFDKEKKKKQKQKTKNKRMTRHGFALCPSKRNPFVATYISIFLVMVKSRVFDWW